jgi:flavin reductase (DIM6/NTAB) family NADH-FMN oxidoreductase RutF
MELLPEDLEIRDRYKLLIGSVVPRPIAFVSTISPAGEHNLAPYSFFTAVGSNPMTLLFCPATMADGKDKDTLRNCLPPEEGGVGEFVVNVATEVLPYGESEFDLTGLTPIPSSKVRPPRLAESPVCFECETLQVLRTNPGQPASGNVVMGRVVTVHVDEELIDERFHIDADLLGAIGRMGGPGYCRTRDRFEMPRGREALNRRDS